jgi:hypothetical protein
MTGKRPYRCSACGWRGWGADLGPRFNKQYVELAIRAMAPEPPNLGGTGLVHDNPQCDRRPLEELDAVAPPSDNRSRSHDSE